MAAKKVAVRKTATKVAARKTAAGTAAAKTPSKFAAKKAAKKVAKTAGARKAATKKIAVTKTSKSTASSGARSTGSLNASERIDKKIASLGDWRGQRLAEIRQLIHDVDPEVVEDWKWMGTPVWSNRGMYVLANPHKDKVKLTFFHGARLADPGKLFNAGLNGGKWRAIDIRMGDKIDRKALKALLREAVAYNATHSVPRSKGSRK